MNTVTYGIIEETYILGNNSRISYGIAVYSGEESDCTSTITVSVRDVSSDRHRVAVLVEKCNCLQLSPVHLCDVVEDFLAD